MTAEIRQAIRESTDVPVPGFRFGRVYRDDCRRQDLSRNTRASGPPFRMTTRGQWQGGRVATSERETQV